MSLSELLTGTNVLIALIVVTVIYLVYKYHYVEPEPVQLVAITKYLPPGHIIDNTVSNKEDENKPPANDTPTGRFYTTGGRLIRTEAPVITRAAVVMRTDVTV